MYSLLLLEWALEGRTADDFMLEDWTGLGCEGAGAKKSKLLRNAAPLDRVVYEARAT